MKKTTLKRMKNITIVMLWLVIIISIVLAVKFYQYEQLHPNREYFYQAYEEKPIELQTKLTMYGQLQGLILLGVLLVSIYFVLDYYYNPDNHFFNNIHNFLKKFETNDEEDKHDGNRKDKV